MNPSARESSRLASSPAANEVLLAIAGDAKPIAGLEQELRQSAYSIVSATSAAQALKILSSQKIALTIVIADDGEQVSDRRASRRSTKNSPASRSSEAREQRAFAIWEEVRTAPERAHVPMLLVASVWSEEVLIRGLESGADSFLFAPYQEQDLLRAVRDALLAGLVEEPGEVLPGVEVVYQDRKHVVKAGRSRLARIAFSVLEQLRQSRAVMGWTRAEIQELRQQIRIQEQQSQIAQAVPEVIQGIAHDFNNLLETISAAATVLGSAPAHPGPYRDAIMTALDQAGMLVATLQNCTDSQAISEPVDLAAIVQQVVNSALLPLRAPNIRVRMQLEGMPLVQSNPVVLFRAISNLIWNAVQAMPSGGMLSVLGYVHGKRVVLEIYDTGTGISEEDQDRVFTPHFSTKKGHSGMGLFLAQKLVQSAGGELTFASRPERGSVFSLSLAPAPAEKTSDQAAPQKGRRTLSG